jgi:hypothetical protein
LRNTIFYLLIKPSVSVLRPWRSEAFGPLARSGHASPAPQKTTHHCCFWYHAKVVVRWCKVVLHIQPSNSWSFSASQHLPKSEPCTKWMQSSKHWDQIILRIYCAESRSWS